MQAIHLVIGGFFGDDLILTGNSVDDIYLKIDDYQNLDCLYRMGRENETSKEGKEGIAKLGEFLDKYHTSSIELKDFEMLNFDISLGGFHVTDAIDDEKAVDVLKSKYPEAKIK